MPLKCFPGSRGIGYLHDYYRLLLALHHKPIAVLHVYIVFPQDAQHVMQAPRFVRYVNRQNLLQRNRNARLLKCSESLLRVVNYELKHAIFILRGNLHRHYIDVSVSQYTRYLLKLSGSVFRENI